MKKRAVPAWRKIWPWALAALVSALVWLVDPAFALKILAVGALALWWYGETLRPPGPRLGDRLRAWEARWSRRRKERAFVGRAHDGGQSSETRSKPDLSGPGPGNCVVYPKPKRRARR